MTEPIVGLEARGRAAGEDDSRARDPVGLLPVDHVPEDIERAEGMGSLRRPQPLVVEPLEPSAKSGGGATKQLRRESEVEVHGDALWMNLKIAPNGLRSQPCPGFATS